jgi:uncharacterized protein YcbK (DUF882 family)
LGFCIAAAMLALVSGTPGQTADATRDRTISLYNIHTEETLTIQYMKAGKHIPEAMEKINWILRDFRKNETTRMDPDLIDLLWEVHNELGSAQPIHIISAYRSRTTNDMLRRTVGGQASQSRHILGKAADVQFPDIPIKMLRYSALIRERGGVGYYPTSAIPFVHIDTDRVRAWPRLPRQELALLFPSGHTQHIPDDGEPISKEDVRRARAADAELAAQIAGFHDQRTHSRTPTTTASLGGSLPQLIALPRLAARPSTPAHPSETDRAGLAALAAEPPRLLVGPMPAMRSKPADDVAAAQEDKGRTQPERLAWAGALRRASGFVPAPAFDDEHPEELSYRPFPIAPLLTATASADDPALATMVHPDFTKTLEFLDAGGYVPPLHLRPGAQTAQLMWAQQFRGEAIHLTSFIDADATSTPPQLAERKVTTQAQ